MGAAKRLPSRTSPPNTAAKATLLLPMRYLEQHLRLRVQRPNALEPLRYMVSPPGFEPGTY
jgi:hypothetical protein